MWVEFVKSALNKADPIARMCFLLGVDIAAREESHIGVQNLFRSIFEIEKTLVESQPPPYAGRAWIQSRMGFPSSRGGGAPRYDTNSPASTNIIPRRYYIYTDSVLGERFASSKKKKSRKADAPYYLGFLNMVN